MIVIVKLRVEEFQFPLETIYMQINYYFKTGFFKLLVVYGSLSLI